MPHCDKCNQPEYVCTCNVNLCAGCGEELSEEEIKLKREICFSCYLCQQD